MPDAPSASIRRCRILALMGSASDRLDEAADEIAAPSRAASPG